MLHKALHLLPPEMAHNFAIASLKKGVVPKQRVEASSKLSQEICGITFRHPVGLAAGFDKNAEAIEGLSHQGFSFVEAGTVTPKPQQGNPKPRLFRLSAEKSIINRMGFNNQGSDVFEKNISRSAPSAVLGINIGKNKETLDAAEDYLKLMTQFYGKSAYITANISSPNTPGLRDIQKSDAMEGFVAALMSHRAELQKEHLGATVPLLVKIAPDLTHAEQEAIVDIAIRHKVDGLIVSNTTLSREGVPPRYRDEAGGLSGFLELEIANKALKNIAKLSNGRLVLVGVGGITNGANAVEKMQLGASLVQVYSGLIYKGFGLVKECVKALEEAVEREGVSNVSELVGTKL